jgi:hypothetical protein
MKERKTCPIAFEFFLPLFFLGIFDTDELMTKLDAIIKQIPKKFPIRLLHMHQKILQQSNNQTIINILSVIFKKSSQLIKGYLTIYRRNFQRNSLNKD